MTTTIENYCCLFEGIEEFRFPLNGPNVILTEPVRIVASRPSGEKPTFREADVVVCLEARSRDEAMKTAAEYLRKSVAILDYAIFAAKPADHSPSTDWQCYIIRRFDEYDGAPRELDPIHLDTGLGNRSPRGCVRLVQDRQIERSDFFGVELTNENATLDMLSHHVPELITICMSHGARTGSSKQQQSVSNSIFAALNQLHKSIRHDFYRDGRELALLRAITGLEALFTELGAHNVGATASAVGYGSAFASLLCQTSVQRTDRWNRVQELYRIWGSIVHGSTTAEPSEQDVLDARRILADSIEACVVWYDDISKTGLQEWVTRQRFECGCRTKGS
jgi:hypothetical protein